MQLLQARETAIAQFRPMLREHGLTEQQWRVLRVLAAIQVVDASELANRCFLLAPSLSRILQMLEREYLIQRESDEFDLRRTLISLTGTGRALYEQVGPDAEGLYQTIEKRFGSKKLIKLYQLLTELNRALG